MVRQKGVVEDWEGQVCANEQGQRPACLDGPLTKPLRQQVPLAAPACQENNDHNTHFWYVVVAKRCVWKRMRTQSTTSAAAPR